MKLEKALSGDISTQEYSANMKDYLETGKTLAISLNNRGPVRRAANGKFHSDILNSFKKYGFYFFEYYGQCWLLFFHLLKHRIGSQGLCIAWAGCF